MQFFRDLIMSNYLRSIGFLLTIALLFLQALPVHARYSKTERLAFQKAIIDKQRQLHPRFKKITRNETKHIIVHTSEAGLKTTLKLVSKGKLLRGHRATYGGHTNYVIARDGRTYRILDKKYEADHAGLSMWNGETDISKISIGIELVGYHYTRITDKQYRSIGILIDILQDVYHLDGSAVLTHSQVAYGKPNRWFKKKHRGRKRCAKNFDRAKAGLGPTWSFDPDVKTGRLGADPELAAIYYGRRLVTASRFPSNVITKSNAAWTIAGEDYNSPTTLYQFPDGRIIPGDQIDKRDGWNSIPRKTIVLLNQDNYHNLKRNRGPVKTISNGLTAWTFAGRDYKKKTTFYFFPQGGMKNGRQITDWDDLPSETKVIVGYSGPYKVTPRRPPLKIVGMRYKKESTLYYFPNKKLIPGDQVKDFRRLPRGVLIFLPS
jgi:N-acetylmuramoyl-L-alanine amidase